ncbi:hypothetical protein [Myroides odoratus]|uniref:hypothetical protein n=1 Tax=Myroides TaxID=76831 RepID=UPI002169D915|nr:hypothetical protein [Myroides odoratus]MCS4239208.1 putative Holliday junction resolvase-like endonuclease [Myroides odoratus]MDH6599486.1 putative Holliday junction resolvase-like endonuclease [Myroides gitamensis]
MIKFIFLLLVLLLDYLSYRYGKSQIAMQRKSIKFKRRSLQKTWSEKRAQLEEKTKQLEREIKEEEDDFDDFIDKDTFNFLLAGAIATLLFLIVGLFTGNPLYFYLIIFLITTLVYVYYTKIQ